MIMMMMMMMAIIYNNNTDNASDAHGGRNCSMQRLGPKADPSHPHSRKVLMGDQARPNGYLVNWGWSNGCDSCKCSKHCKKYNRKE